MPWIPSNLWPSVRPASRGAEPLTAPGAMAVNRAGNRRSRACAPALALLGLAVGGLLAPCFDAASPQARVTPPKRPASSYMLWLNENRGRLQSELGTKNVAQIAKEAGRQWGEIEARVKSEYEGRVAALKREYDVELAKFVAAGGKVAKGGRNSKAKKDPNTPKRPMGAYFLWLSENRDRLQSELGTKNVAQIAKEAGRQWGEIEARVKSEYEGRAAALKREYDVEQDKIVAEGGKVAKGGKNSKARKDPNTPKRPMSAYFLWLSENRDRLQSELGTKNVAQIAKEAGRQWGEIEARVKSEYEGRAAALKREYDVEQDKIVAEGGKVAKGGKKPVAAGGEVAKGRREPKAKEDPNAPKEEFFSGSLNTPAELEQFRRSAALERG
ncbi:unnamed protein product [Prorocentrum cordatum]|uniref:HMG box domain-containing protein n=1 Tax=Prorocentrum cordatum TaxID=2364126 RepID=A0ABN9R779_9DINO|nr:unnamed protein product [Polarella glacialis]